MPRPLYPWETEPIPTGGRQGRFGRVRKISPSLGFFFFLNSFSSSLFVSFPHLFLCLDCPGLCLCLYCTTHNTNTFAPTGIRTRNPSKLASTDPRLRPLDHCNRRHSSNVPSSQYSRYTERVIRPTCWPYAKRIYANNSTFNTTIN